MRKDITYNGLQKTTYIKDDMDGKIAIKEEVNVNSHLKHNKKLLTLNDGYSASIVKELSVEIIFLILNFELKSFSARTIKSSDISDVRSVLFSQFAIDVFNAEYVLSAIIFYPLLF